MDEYVIGGVADLISNQSSKIKGKKRLKLSDEAPNQIQKKNYNEKNETSSDHILKLKNKSLEENFSTEKVNLKTPTAEIVDLKVKVKSQLNKRKKFLEPCSTDTKENGKSLVRKKSKIDLDFLDHKPHDCVENKIENVKKISVRNRKFSNTAVVKKDFLENTIFVGNIPVNYEKRKICKVFSKFGEIQSVRIRCVPIADINMSKKVAAIKKKFNPKRKSLVAYVKFKSQDSVNAALEANGMIIDGHHLRIDSAEKNKERDNNKAVFVGGLPFDTEDDELWEFFQNCGKIISVHIIRDSQTSMGKGFGYVNFDSTASVELALQLDSQEFKKRTINVNRCIKAKNRHKLCSFDRKKSKEVVTTQLLCKRGKKFKEEKKKLKREKKSFSSDFQGKKANIKQKKKKKLSKAALHQKKLVKILNKS